VITLYITQEAMMDNDRTTDKLAEASKTVSNETLNTVEAAVSSAIDSTKDVVHELRNDAMEAVNQTVDQTVGSVKETVEQQRPRFEQYIEEHPWIMLGGLVIGWYFQARRRETLNR
jgi:ElaB/YqjD/DUF883 family membrane-anchored ribosome-binding protein